jgi:glycosyltransferase involved in cell wall biosynthesis
MSTSIDMPPPLNIDVYSVCHNEAEFLPYFLSHYETFARQIIVYDNHSTDSSRDILRSHPKVRLIEGFGQPDVFEEDDLTALRNTCWKGSDADWVIVCDIDELLHAEDLPGELRRVGRPMVKPQGIDLVHAAMPEPGRRIIDTIHTGLLNDASSKPILFQPLALRETQFTGGSHAANPVFQDGETVHVAIGDPTHRRIQLLHCMFVGYERCIRKRMDQYRRTEQANWYRPPGFDRQEWLHHITAGYAENPFRRRVAIGKFDNIKWYTCVLHDAPQAEFTGLGAALHSALTQTDLIPVVLCDQPCPALDALLADSLTAKYVVQVVYPTIAPTLHALPARIRECLLRLSIPLLEPDEPLILATDSQVVFNALDSATLRALADQADAACCWAEAPPALLTRLPPSAVCLLAAPRLTDWSREQIAWLLEHWPGWDDPEPLCSLYRRLPDGALGRLPETCHWHCDAPVNPAARLLSLRPGVNLRRHQYPGCEATRAVLDTLPPGPLAPPAPWARSRPTLRYAKSPLVDGEWLDAELLLIHQQTQQMQVLNAAAAILWEALDMYPTASALAELLCEAQPELPRRDALITCLDFLTTLAKAGFVLPETDATGADAAYRAAPEVDIDAHDGQLTLIHTRTLAVRELDARATRLWHALPHAPDIGTLAALLRHDEPDLGEDAAVALIDAVLTDLIACGFVLAAPAAAAGAQPGALAASGTA